MVDNEKDSKQTYSCTLCHRVASSRDAFYRIPPDGMNGKFYAVHIVAQSEENYFYVCPLCYEHLSCYKCHGKGARPRVILKYKNNEEKNIIQVVCDTCYADVYKEC